MGLKKQELCKLAGIKPEMYSYVLKRGRLGLNLPTDCVDKILGAITHLARQAKRRTIK